MDSTTVQRLSEVRLVMKQADIQGVMTMDEVAHAFGISRRTFQKRKTEGRLPIQPVDWSDREVLYLRSDVERVLSGQRRSKRRAA